MLEPSEVFDAWAPPGPPWTRWAKPVLFSSLTSNDLAGPGPIAEADASWAPLASRAAIVVDLPAERVVALGIALVERGYRPVPLFNGVAGLSALVPTGAIVRDLVAGAAVLRSRRLRDDAPPAFLLDSGRSGGAQFVRPGMFDNRWCVLPQDLPSATVLRAHGIDQVLVVCEPGTGFGDAVVATDLAHVLRRYQDDGLRLGLLRPGAMSAERLDVPRPPWFRSLWYRMMVLAGLRRNSAGGFGAVVPDPGSGGGFA